MGGGKAGFNVNRTEFMPDNALDGDIEYQRGGGCFVSTKKAVFLAILAILALVAVGAFIYFYKAQTIAEKEDSTSDIEQLLNNSLHTTDNEDLRIPSSLRPLHYRLRIQPYLDEPTKEKFTFTGQVTISIQCVEPTKKIILHSEDLIILEKEVTVATTKTLHLSSLSQVKSEVPNAPNVTVENTGNNTQPGVVRTNISTSDNSSIGKNIEEPHVIQQPVPIAPNVPVAINTSSTLNPIPTVIAISTPAVEVTEKPAPLPQPVPLPQPTPIPQSVPVPQLLPPSTNATLPQASLPNKNATLHPEVAPVSPDTSPNNNHNQTLSVNGKKVEPTTVLPSVEHTSVPNPVYQIPNTNYLKIKRQEEIQKLSRYVIELTTALEVGQNYTLDIQFSGKISNNLVGLYKTNYLNDEGRKRWIVTTNFQPVFARRVFPCFDEPSFKSAFEISIARRTNMSALSNMPLKESEQVANQPGWVWDHFEKTPPMSTHLVAFTVSDFESLQSTSAAELGPVFKIWAPKNSLPNSQYALQVGPKILSYLQQYFGIKYPLSKIDLVAIPELPQTAVENWGVISFRDTALLLDPHSDSWETRNHIFKSIAGKLAKQWFGNLVTMQWWSDFWLSEGFSTYMEDAVESSIEPTLEDLDTFSLRITQTILDSDKLKSVRSLHVDIKDSTQIEQLFDDVSSNKGSCLIRMLNYTFTEPLFKEAIRHYLKTWMYKTATQDNFWESFTELSQNITVLPSDLTVKEFMNPWIEQEGFPVVTVTRNYETGSANISQRRFVHGNDTNNHLWHIPLTYTRGNDQGAVSTMWLKKEEAVTAVNFTTPGNQEWVIFNIDGAGLYRANYDIQNWELLQNQLINDSSKITPTNRGQLLNDAFELANMGLLNYRTAFGLTKYLPVKERNYIPWYSLFNSLKPLNYVMGSSEHNGIFEKYILNIIKPIYDELGTVEKPNEPQNDKLLRTTITKVACAINHEPCLSWAQQKYQEWMASAEPDKINPIPFSFRKTVQCSAIKMGGLKEWRFLWERSLYPSISPTDLKEIYLSLGCTREPWLINSYLEKSLNGSIALQNVGYVWKSIAHPVGLSVGFTFLRIHWDRIYENYKHLFSTFNNIFEDFLSRLSTKVDLEDLTTFYKNHKETMYPVSSLMLNVVERIKWRISWSESHIQTVVAWLQENRGN